MTANNDCHVGEFLRKFKQKYSVFLFQNFPERPVSDPQQEPAAHTERDVTTKWRLLVRRAEPGGQRHERRQLPAQRRRSVSCLGYSCYGCRCVRSVWCTMRRKASEWGWKSDVSDVIGFHLKKKSSVNLTERCREELTQSLCVVSLEGQKQRRTLISVFQFL